MEDLNDKVTGSTLSADQWNQVPSEIQNVIEALGISLSAADLNQLGKAISGYSANGDAYVDGGVADAYTLTSIGSKQAPPAYTNLMRVRFRAANQNTGASTVNVAGLGVKDIKFPDGTDVLAGQISGLMELVFDSANDYFVLATPGLMVRVVFGASDPTWTPPVGAKTIDWTVVGGGGGAGGVDGQGAGTAACSVAGAGGGWGLKRQYGVDATYNITVGAGGTGGGPGSSGTDGGTTSVVSSSLNLTAPGGSGGSGMVASSGTQTGQGVAGGLATGCDLNFRGSASTGSRTGSGDIKTQSIAGDSIFGGRGATGYASLANFLYGAASGAGGGAVVVEDQTTDAPGGAGGNGIVIAEIHF